MTLSLLEHKSLLRKKLRAERQRRSEDAFNMSVFMENFIRYGLCPLHSVIAGYVPVRGELNALPLLNYFRTREHSITLPRIVQQNKPLEFRLWNEACALVPNHMGLLEPSVDCPLAEPDVVIVPLLAFDKERNRLGYGGGFYDRTLKELRTKKKIQAIGVAYSYQEVEGVPIEPHDVKLNQIVTEVNVF